MSERAAMRVLGVYMLPGFITNNAMDSHVCNAKLLSEMGLMFALDKALANLAHLFLRELGANVGLTFSRCIDASAFCIHIPHVVESSSYKQVSWVDTGGIVAFVETVKAIWYGAVVKLPRETVSENMSAAAIYDAKRTVAGTIYPGSPQPTLIGAAVANLLPKAFNGRASIAMVVYEAKRLAFYMAEPGVIFFGDFSFLSASTVAVTWFDLLRGIVRKVKLELHKKLTFLVSSLGTFRDVAGVLSIGFYRFILAHLNEYSKGKSFMVLAAVCGRLVYL